MLPFIFFLVIHYTTAFSYVDTTNTITPDAIKSSPIRITASEAQTLLLKELEINNSYSLDIREYSTQMRLLHITMLLGLGGIIFLSSLRGHYFSHLILIFLVYIGFVYVKETMNRDIHRRINSRYTEIYKTHAYLSERPDTSWVLAYFNETSKFNHDSIKIIPDFTEKDYKRKINCAFNPDLETSYIYLFIFMSLCIFSITKKDKDNEKLILRFPYPKAEKYRFILTWIIILLCGFFLFNILRVIGIF